jgi:excisionase family DNA binding protein
MTDAWADRERTTPGWNFLGSAGDGGQEKAKASLDAVVDAFATTLAQRLAEALEPALLRISTQQSVRQDQLPPTMSVPEAAEFLRVGKSAVYEAVRTGNVPSLRIGRRIRVPSHALLKRLDLT